MKLTYLLLSSGIAGSDKIIKNINVPACKNCMYYKPRMFDRDFTSTFNICEKFGTKNIITDKITYDYADLCRQSDDKCGQEGKYFEKAPYIKLKIMKHAIISHIPLALFILTPSILAICIVINKCIH